MKSTYLAAVAMATLALFVAPSLSACVATDPGIANYPSGNDLNDYGALFIDAGDPNCAQGAMYNLTTKLTNHLNASGSFQNWLDGYYVALIYGAALRLGELGWANKDLDWQLDYSPDSHMTVANKFLHADSGICNPEAFNTCMDDFAGTAAAYGWMAAYKSRRVIPGHNTADGDVKDARDAAANYIHQSMNAVCIRMKPIDRNEFPVCDGNVDALRAGDAETLTVNGTVQLIHYGFGLMTSVLSAAQGYEVAGGGKFQFSEPEQVIARGLYDEIARHADSSGNYRTPADCLKLQNGAISGNSPCDGSVISGVMNPPSYLPNMYKLKGPYDYYFPNVIPDPPSTAYTSTTFDGGLFNSFHFGYGRLATYRDMGGDWIPNGAPNMPYDNYDPVDGWLDSISPSGLASGWTCDPDAPDKAVRVDIYAGELWPPVYEPPAATGYANLSSEGAVNSACGGGWAHRYQIQLPGWTQGMSIHVFGLDYTWYGFTEVHCGPNPCSW